MNHRFTQLIIFAFAMGSVICCGNEAVPENGVRPCKKVASTPVPEAIVKKDQPAKPIPATLKATFVKKKEKTPFINQKLALLRFETPEAAKPDANGQIWRNVSETKVVSTDEKGKITVYPLVAGDYAISLVDAHAETPTGKIVLVDGKTSFGVANGTDLNLGKLEVVTTQ